MSTRSDIPPLTRNQSLVKAVLADDGSPLSAYQILDRLREEGLKAPLQVYRALDKLMEFGEVHRLESLNAFVACQHHDHRHPSRVGFAICDDCGTVREFPAESMARPLDRWAREQCFELTSTVVELHGSCLDCRQPGRKNRS